MSKKPGDKISGRAVADEKGNQKWVWQSEGEKPVDTAVIKALGEGLSLEDGSGPGKAPGAGTGSNPYDRSNPYERSSAPGRAPPPGDKPAKRRTLDDMRKLSEEIKRAKLKTDRS
jgi:hypothetical protein